MTYLPEPLGGCELPKIRAWVWFLVEQLPGQPYTRTQQQSPLGLFLPVSAEGHSLTLSCDTCPMALCTPPTLPLYLGSPHHMPLPTTATLEHRVESLLQPQSLAPDTQ